MIFVDTNYFLRFLLADIAAQHNAAKNLFEQAARGELKLVTSTLVFFEIFWVLSSFYEKHKTELIVILKDILRMEFIGLKERGLLIESLDIFQKNNIELEDAYNLVYARGLEVDEFRTFDKKLSRLYQS